MKTRLQQREEEMLFLARFLVGCCNISAPVYTHAGLSDLRDLRFNGAKMQGLVKKANVQLANIAADSLASSSVFPIANSPPSFLPLTGAADACRPCVRREGFRLEALSIHRYATSNQTVLQAVMRLSRDDDAEPQAEGHVTRMTTILDAFVMAWTSEDPGSGGPQIIPMKGKWSMLQPGAELPRSDPSRPALLFVVEAAS